MLHKTKYAQLTNKNILTIVKFFFSQNEREQTESVEAEHFWNCAS